MLQLYIANKNYSSWSLRPWILLKQLGIDFEEHLQPFGSGDFRHFSPTAKVPCLIDDGMTVWDSLAICEYLAESHPEVWPADRIARAWARCASAEMHSGFTAIRNICPMSCGVRVRLRGTSATLQKEWQRVDQLWQQGLERFSGPFLAGEQFTAVDAFFAPLAFRVQTYAPKLSVPATDYVQRLLQLDAMQQWYAAALKETWRDAAHEQEIARTGVILKDLRASR